MSVLSTQEAEVCDTNPIHDALDGFREAFTELFEIDNSDSFRDLVNSLMTMTNNVARNLIRKLFVILLSLPAASLLQSRQSTEPIIDSIALCISQLSSGELNVNATALLLERVIQRAPDHDIWCAVYNLFSPSTPVDTSAYQPRQPVTVNRVPDTPFSFKVGSVYNTGESRKSEFFGAFFDSVDNLSGLVDDAFAHCQDNGHYNTNCWMGFPDTCEEPRIATWFQNEVYDIVESALHSNANHEHAVALNSRRVVSSPEQPVLGSTAPRKLDIGFAALDRLSEDVPSYSWKDILVPGELKKNQSDDRTPSTWHDLGRYVREVYNSQDNRRFCHGFTLCGPLMRVWRYDRGAIYTALPFNVNVDGRRFVTVVLGYHLMRDHELGFDSSILRDPMGRYIPVMRHGVAGRIFLQKVIHRQACILGRATTCWKGIGEDGITTFVIKDSWQYGGKDDEGDLLRYVTDREVANVAPCYHSTSVRILDTVDDLHHCVRNRVNLLNCEKWGVKKGRASGASMTVDTGSQSTTPGNSPPPEQQPQNRIHKRVIMSRCGKQLYLASSRTALLRALIDGIAGHQNLLSHGILHRDISIGNVLITEDESKGLLIDLDHAIRINRDQNSGETGSIGTKIFMSIGLLSQRDDQFRQHSFMDDLESMFWLLFWICVHYSGPDGSPVQSTYYEDWNFFSPMQLGTLKAGTVINPNFLSNAYKDFTDFYRPLAPCVDKLRSGVFPNGVCWQQEDRNLYKKMQDVLRAAMEDPSVIGDRPEPPRHHTRSKGSRGIMKGLP